MNPMNDEQAGRLEKIESSVAHLEHLYEQLNQVVLEQSKQVAKALAQQQRASQAIENLELERLRSSKEKPPHYQ